jgi:HD superfamily phosphohydrolase
MTKNQRIRDPLHDLIEFENNEFDQLLWNLLNTKEFQRLRRIKQLGFSELVYPGATHTRFAHSIGVYHTAKKLFASIQQKIENFDQEKAKIALAAALVHDLGHGAFSHAFEEATKSLNEAKAKLNGKNTEKLKRHELWTSDILTLDTDISAVLRNYSPDFQQSVSDLLVAETPTDIYGAVVSSQFDADRLDYVRRDRLMTGAKHGGFDFSWLLANLEIGQIPLAVDNEEIVTVDTLVLGHKALQAAESYVLGLFHMYFTVYFHKTTRSAEKMLSGILLRVGQLLIDDNLAATGMISTNPIVQFLSERNLDAYLNTDDFVMWGSLSVMSQSNDLILKELSSRLLKRELYKVVDISNHFNNELEVYKFRAELSKAKSDGMFDEFEIFEDRPKRSPYKIRGYGSPEALSKVHIKSNFGGNLIDLSECSQVVKALDEKSLYRIYVRDDTADQKIKELIGRIN